MSSSAALRMARAAGIIVKLDGGDLVLEALSEPSSDILDLLLQHKAGILELLRRDGDGSEPEDWRDLFDERAAIAEFCGGLTREAAEARAFACCIAEWLNRNGVRSPPGRCFSCCEGARAYDPLLPFRTESSGHVWLHANCWRIWHERRKAQAIAALGAQGINLPALPHERGRYDERSP